MKRPSYFPCALACAIALLKVCAYVLPAGLFTAMQQLYISLKGEQSPQRSFDRIFFQKSLAGEIVGGGYSIDLFYKSFLHCKAFHNRTRKESDIFSQENPSLARDQRSQRERPKNYFAPKIKSEIILPAAACRRYTYFRSARCAFVGRCPTPRDPFEKGSIENFQFLDKN